VVVVCQRTFVVAIPHRSEWWREMMKCAYEIEPKQTVHCTKEVVGTVMPAGCFTLK